MENLTIEKIVAMAKSRGFVYAGSEIYGGLANSWDFGPLGIELKNNIKSAWWKKFVQQSPYNVGLDSAIIMNSNIWKASGHVDGFSDPLMDCKECKERFRADKLIDEFFSTNNIDETSDGWDNKKMSEFIVEKKIKCPTCDSLNFTDIRQFNLMFKTYTGVTEDSKNEVYLRPETAQGIFVNFKNVQRTSRKKIPFGIAQIGKTFRNEITPGNFIFRTREFEQMELEFFCKPGEDIEWHTYWKNYCFDFLLNIGIDKENIRLRDHSAEELSHYSNATSDIEYKYPFGFGEIWGIADRTNYDLTQHQKHSNEELMALDIETNEKFIPYVIEPSVGVDRLLLALLCEAYDEEVISEENGKEDTRVVLRFHNAIAPIKVAVLPLSKKLNEDAQKIYEQLSAEYMCDFDDTGSIGKRYRRQDEIGTPYCITFDFDSMEDNCVTVRDRDTMKQERIKIEGLNSYFAEKFKF